MKIKSGRFFPHFLYMQREIGASFRYQKGEDAGSALQIRGFIV